MNKKNKQNSPLINQNQNAKSPIAGLSSLEDATNDSSSTKGGSSDWSWITNSGNGLAKILDVILNGGDSSAVDDSDLTVTTENSSSSKWWIIGGIAIIIIVILIAVFIKKNK